MPLSMQPKLSLFALGACALALGVPAARAQSRVISTDLTNIAAAANGGRVLGSTSTFDKDPLYNANNLIDGQVWSATRAGSSHGWASDKFDPITMDTVTLGFAGNRVFKIGRIVLNPTTDLPPERWAKDIEVQVSTQSAEGPYAPVAQLTLRQSAAPQSFDVLPTNARFVKLVFRSNYGSDRAVSLGEVEIYEAIGNADPMGSVINRLEKAVTDLTRYRQLQEDGGLATPTATASANGPKFQNVQLGGASGSKQDIAAAKNGGRIVGVSSTYNNDQTYGPQTLIDGDNYRQLDNKGSNGWASQGFEPGKEFVTIGFAADRTHLLGKVTLNPASNQSDLRWARRVEMQTTTDSPTTGPWKTVGVFNLRGEPVNQDFEIRPVEAKYARFVFQANGPGIKLPNADPNVNSDRAVSLGEIEIYEAQTGDDQLAALVGQFNGVLTDLKTLRRRDIEGDRPNSILSPTVAPTPAPTPALTTGTAGPLVAPKSFPAKPAPAAAPAKPAPKPALTPAKTPTNVKSRLAPPRPVEANAGTGASNSG